ncbi:MAG: ATP phosphoribosyltransferase regulatory subunit [Clostridia bacterium]|nr:ATP phosphoribosyltransferase regulatory subunit [Clostridia bacterium]
MSDYLAGMRPDEILSAKLRAIYVNYGYRIYKVNRFEAYDLYVQNKNFLTDERILTFTDLNGHLKALKPDITLSVVRNTRDEALPVRVCYSESAYRVPRGETGFHEIMQTGVEYIGCCDDAVLAEIILLAEKSLMAISDRYALDISHMGLVSELLKSAQVPEADFSIVLEMIRKKDRHGLRAYADMNKMSHQACELLDMLIVLNGPIRPALSQLSTVAVSEACTGILKRLSRIVDIVESVWQGYLNLDFSVLSDMRYYNGLTLSGFIDGIPSPVLAGGQYDPLLSRLGREGQGIGFAVYLNQIDRCLDEQAEHEPSCVMIGQDPKAAFIEAEKKRVHGPVVLMPQEKDGDPQC